MSSGALGSEARQWGASPRPAFPVPPQSKGSEAAGRWEREGSGIRIPDCHHLRLRHRSKGSGSPPVHTYLARCTKLQRKGTHVGGRSEEHPCFLWGLLDPPEEDPILILSRENGLRPMVSDFILVAHSRNKSLVGEIIESFDEIPDTPAEITADDLRRRAPDYRKARRRPNTSR